jgi:2-polyprenyl-6-methoxyphenol hydroxylase-like FAD-dependent oxidoreductase
MRTSSLHDQLAASAGDRLRVLVAGAGIAGLTVARHLRRGGLHPVVVERAGPAAGTGYMLGLMPLIDPAIDIVDLRERYRAASVELNRYLVRDRHARPIREDPVAQVLGRFGSYRGISRAALLDVLGAEPATPVSFGTTVRAVRPDDDRVQVRLGAEDGETDAAFDLVIAADGMQSATRGLILAPAQVSTYDSGWGGWVAWAPPDRDTDRIEEVWGAGFFAGTYPVRDRIGVFLGGPRTETASGAGPFTTRIRAALPALGPRLDNALRAVADAPDPYYWPLRDVRAHHWAVGRCVLLGDAAAAFLPTAGIGAGMAMESAHVLAAHVLGTPPERIPGALRDYERVQRPRVTAAQDNSRQLARLMFRRGAMLAAVRDTAARYVSLDVALRPITRLLRTRPEVPART